MEIFDSTMPPPPPNSKLMFKRNNIGWGNHIDMSGNDIAFSYNYKRFSHNSNERTKKFSLNIYLINQESLVFYKGVPIDLIINSEYNLVYKKYSEIPFIGDQNGMIVVLNILVRGIYSNGKVKELLNKVIHHPNGSPVKIHIELDSGSTFINGGYVLFKNNTTIPLQ